MKLYRLPLLTPVQLLPHDLHDAWQRLIGRLHVQKAQTGSPCDDVDGRAGVLLNRVQHLKKKTTHVRLHLNLETCSAFMKSDVTSLSMYGNSDTSLFPTIGHLCPVTCAILATSNAFPPYVEARCWATWGTNMRLHENSYRKQLQNNAATFTDKTRATVIITFNHFCAIESKCFILCFIAVISLFIRQWVSHMTSVYNIKHHQHDNTNLLFYSS